MSKIEKIIEELKNIHNGDAWHGASLADALDAITFEQAAAHPVETSGAGMIDLLLGVLFVGAYLKTARD